jgi:hypothetical protein
MKKKLLTAAIMAALTVSTASAFAAAPVITGDFQTMIQTQRGVDSDYSDVRLRLNFDQELSDGMYAHARLMGIDQQGFGNNYAEAGTGSKGADMNMEQMYIGAKLGQFDAKFGRQPLSVGQNMLADVNGIVGVSFATKVSDLDMYAFTGRETTNGVTNDVLAAKVGTAFAGVDMGAGYLKRDLNKYWSVDAGTKIADNVYLSGIYMANTYADANGFMAKAAVGSVAKKGDFSYAVSYRDVEDGAIDGDWVTNGALANSKGVRLEAKYKPTNDATLWVYQDITSRSSDTSYHPNQFRAEIDINF